ncbi:MAG: hypothetical protein QXZ09_06080 [Candidatus Methanomethylicaceae archaeon]
MRKHSVRCELSRRKECACRCGGALHGISGGATLFQEVVRCLYCKAPLRFDQGKGWVHPGGALYMMRCSNCGRFTDDPIVQKRQFCQCGGYFVDDHCAVPERR